MAGAKVAPEKKDQELPPHAAGREVLSYVQQQEKEADDAFAAAHGVAPEEEGTEEETEEEKAAAEKEATAAKAEEKEKTGTEAEAKVAENDDDLTKGLNTENASKRISSAQSRMHDSNKRANTAEGERDRLLNENEALQKRLDTVPEAPAAKAVEAEPKTEVVTEVEEDDLKATMEELNQEYPEIAKPMLKIMAMQQTANKVLSDKLDTLEQKEVTRTAEAKTAQESTHYKAISDVHKDFKEISDEPLLDDWIEGLPAIERAGAMAIRKNGSTGDVIELLTSFKQANGYELPAESKDDIPPKKGNSKLDKAKKAANPSFNKAKDVNISDGKAPFTRVQIDAMTMEEYKEHEEAIDVAMSKGFPPQ